MHVFAVSGLHVGIVLAFLWGLLRWLGVPRRYAVIVLIPAILFYATVTGLRPSAVRAAIMGSVVLLGFVAERKPRLLNSLAFAALLILALDKSTNYSTYQSTDKSTNHSAHQSTDKSTSLAANRAAAEQDIQR